MLINQRCSYSKTALCPFYRSFTANYFVWSITKELFSPTVARLCRSTASSLLFLYVVNLFCHPVWPVTTPNTPFILHKLSDTFVKIHSQRYHFACSAYHYTSWTPLIFLHHFVFFQIYISQENIIAAKLFYYLSS